MKSTTSVSSMIDMESYNVIEVISESKNWSISKTIDQIIKYAIKNGVKKNL